MRSVPTSGFRDPSDGSGSSRIGPVEPLPSRWRFPSINVLQKTPPGYEVVAQGADLCPGSLLAGYRAGMFGMYDGDRLLWWSPDPRGVLHPGKVHISRSMHRVRNKLTASLDCDFTAVLSGCADPLRPGGWITADYAASYAELHALGWAHSVEIWDGPRLVAGLFGVQLGGLFAAESMFHDPEYGASASRLAVIALCEVLDGPARALIDVQWPTAHLAGLGVVGLPRIEYLTLLPALLAQPPATGWSLSRESFPAQPESADRTAVSQGSRTRPSRIRWVTGPPGSVVWPKYDAPVKRHHAGTS